MAQKFKLITKRKTYKYENKRNDFRRKKKCFILLDKKPR